MIPYVLYVTTFALIPYDIKVSETMFRFKFRWIEQGEKPTKYFFNLEKKKYEKKLIKELKTENPAESLINIKDIGNKIEEHLTQLLRGQIAEDEVLNKANFDSFVEDLAKLTN